jgi:hypothetical protein
MMAELIETQKASGLITDIIRRYYSQQDRAIMQPTCNKLCARLAAIAFDLIGWHDDMAGFWDIFDA